jgi:hypothetical protein
VENFSST